MYAGGLRQGARTAAFEESPEEKDSNTEKSRRAVPKLHLYLRVIMAQRDTPGAPRVGKSDTTMKKNEPKNALNMRKLTFVELRTARGGAPGGTSGGAAGSPGNGNYCTCSCACEPANKG